MGEDVCVQCLGGHRLGVLDPKGRGQPLQNREGPNLGARGRPGLVLLTSSTHTHTYTY